MFEIIKQQYSSFHSIRPRGRLDTVHSASFDQTVREVTSLQRSLVIDFSECSYLSSSGIRVLLRTSKELGAQGGKLAICGFSEDLFRVFQTAGLDLVFNLFNELSEAEAFIEEKENAFSENERVFTENIPWKTELLKKIPDTGLRIWEEPVLTDYGSLTIAAGSGAFGETLLRSGSPGGSFFTLFHCTGLIPDDRDYAPDFRIAGDPSLATVFVDRALSVRESPMVKISVEDGQKVKVSDILQYTTHLSCVDGCFLCAAVCLEQDPDKPALSIYLSRDSRIWQGGTFLLQRVTRMQPHETFQQYCRSLLTWENVEGIAAGDVSAMLRAPVCWLFYSQGVSAGAGYIPEVIFTGETLTEKYYDYLTRALYRDSEKVEIKRLHGGYSASTFYVKSFDDRGRVLRPTVLKIGARSLISREAERCRKYAMPYILNNSAMVLGTAFHCQIGALRYNFVGIGGEDTGLKWLTWYFHNMDIGSLKPLFDKIFLKILKPWYGQPVKEKIYPFDDHDPTKTFFPDIFEKAESILGIDARDVSFRIDGSLEDFLNPYRFLKEEYPKRRQWSLDYYTCICHGDLNMQNILLDNEMNVYLIDFSETRPRSVVSDFARLEAIFMIESFPMQSEEDFLMVLELLVNFYERPCSLDKIPDVSWKGRLPQVMERNIALTKKMRKYAISSAREEKTFVPYTLALLEWVLPIVCYSSATVWQKQLSACVASLLCESLKNK
ncbi:MAG: anti-sigma factor antagonist [Bacteroidales bacterium]|nr:anti-sigma factor antagonist [Bacteroidales bacterium]MDD3549585.1 anti-sigma factor antagonist [Bacteroidales bacterium]